MSEEQKNAEGLSARLEAQYSKSVGDKRAEEIRALEAIANVNLEPLQIFEAGVPLMCICILGALFIGGGSVLMLLKGGMQPTALGGVAVGIVWLLFCIHWFIRKRTPMLTFGPNGLRIRHMEGELPWLAVTDFELNSMGIPITTSTELDIYLDPNFPAPTTRGGGLKVRYWPKKQMISVRAVKYDRDMDKFGELFQQYWQAAFARKALAEMKDK